MKKIQVYSLIFSLALLLSSCFEDRRVFYEDSVIEFENAVMTAPATGQLFPIINLTRASGTPSYQMNLVGEQLAQSETIAFSLDAVPASLLNANTIVAQEGVHYTLSGSSVTFPSAQSTAPFTGLTILPGFPAQAGRTALLILKLDGNEKIKPSENHRRLGIRINLN